MRRLLRGEVPRHTTEEQGVGDAIDDRVEERTTLAGSVGRLGQCPVEQVGQRREDHEHETDAQFAHADGNRRTNGDHEPHDGEVIGRHAGASEADTDGLDRPVHRGSELSVEHATQFYPTPATMGAHEQFSTQRPGSHLPLAPPPAP